MRLEVPQLVTRSVYCGPPRWTPFRFEVCQPIADLPLWITSVFGFVELLRPSWAGALYDIRLSEAFHEGPLRGLPRLCATYEGELCPACSHVSVGSKARAAASTFQALRFLVSVTCLLPVVSSTLHLALQPLLAPPPNPFQQVDQCKCPLGSWAHEAEILESAKDENITVSTAPSGYTMAPGCQFGGFAMG